MNIGRTGAGRFEDLRELYLDTVAKLRAHEIPIDDLCISVILSKNPDTYAKSGRREEQYEVLLASGHNRWKGGDRVRPNMKLRLPAKPVASAN